MDLAKLEQIKEFVFSNICDDIQITTHWLNDEAFNSSSINRKHDFIKLILEFFESCDTGEHVYIGNIKSFVVTDIYFTLDLTGKVLRLWCGEQTFTTMFGMGCDKMYHNLIAEINFYFDCPNSFMYDVNCNPTVSFIEKLGYKRNFESEHYFFRK